MSAVCVCHNQGRTASPSSTLLKGVKGTYLLKVGEKNNNFD